MKVRRKRGRDTYVGRQKGRVASRQRDTEAERQGCMKQKEGGVGSLRFGAFSSI